MDLSAILFIAAFAFASVALAVGSTANLQGHRWGWVLLPIATLMWAILLVFGFAAISYLSW